VGVVCKHVSESFALRVLSVSFLGVSLLLKGRLGRGFGARFGGVHTGAGEKHVVRAGGNLSAGTFNAGSKEQKPDNGRCDEGCSLAGYVALVGSVLLLPNKGFDTCGGGTHTGADENEVKDPVRDGGSLGTEVADVEGRDEETLTIDDRLDDMIDVSEG
jgi:hypothetical protein